MCVCVCVCARARALLSTSLVASTQVEALKAQLEAQQSRWETALADDATERAKEEEAFKSKEEELLQQLNAVQHDTQELRALADKTKNQLGASIVELDAEIRQSAQALEAEEELAKSLQHRLSLLEAQQDLFQGACGLLVFPEPHHDAGGKRPPPVGVEVPHGHRVAGGLSGGCTDATCSHGGGHAVA